MYPSSRGFQPAFTWGKKLCLLISAIYYCPHSHYLALWKALAHGENATRPGLLFPYSTAAGMNACFQWFWKDQWKSYSRNKHRLVRNVSICTRQPNILFVANQLMSENVLSGMQIMFGSFSHREIGRVISEAI